MPGFDRSGPRGMGPMTGRGMGYCATPASGGSGWGRGQFRAFRWGRGGGYGRGFGFGRGYYGPMFPEYRATVAPEDERAMLRDEARAMEEELKRIQTRISELDE